MTGVTSIVEHQLRVQRLVIGSLNVLLLGIVNAFFFQNKWVQLCFIIAVAGMSLLQRNESNGVNYTFAFPLQMLFDHKKQWLLAALCIVGVVPLLIRTTDALAVGSGKWEREFFSELLQGTIPNLLLVATVASLAEFLSRISTDFRTLSNHLKGFRGGLILSIIAQTIFPFSWLATILYYQKLRNSRTSEVFNAVFIGLIVYTAFVLVVATYSYYIGNTKRLSTAPGIAMPNRAFFLFLAYNLWWPLVPLVPGQTYYGTEKEFDLYAYFLTTEGFLAGVAVLASAAYRANRAVIHLPRQPWRTWYQEARTSGLAKATVLLVSQIVAVLGSALLIWALRHDTYRSNPPTLYVTGSVLLASAAVVVMLKVVSFREQEIRRKLEGLGWSIMRTGKMSHDVWTDSSRRGRVVVPRGDDIASEVYAQISEQFGQSSTDMSPLLDRDVGGHEVRVRKQDAGPWWVFDIPALQAPSPIGGTHQIVARGQTRSAADVGREARDIIEMWTAEPCIDWGSTLPDDSREAVRDARAQGAAAEAAERNAEDAVCRAARILNSDQDLKLTPPDIATILGVPLERIEALIFETVPE